ncbi:MAG: hypothetical protein P9M11_07195 [Candidatus Tenebribacter burtonii]|nr:hypothetical protein [Candidatus Tenebribacter burtonii]
MYSFLFIKTTRNTEQIVKKTSRIILKILSDLDFQLTSRISINDKTGWFIVEPEVKVKHNLFHTFSQNDIQIIFYGDLVISLEKNPAKELFKTWKDGGINAARKLNGCFSVIINNKKKNEVIAFSDIFGLRRLRYYNDNNTTIISTQDIPIMATGLVPINYDFTSLYSILALDWSLRGNSIIQNIYSIHPVEILRIKQNRTYLINQPLITDENRIDITDKGKIKENIDNTIDLMQQEIELRIKDADKIQLDLTAGRDTRAILGLILSKQKGQKIFSTTMGHSTNLEVIAAKKIAQLFNIEHKNSIPQTIDKKFFIRHAELLAFTTNGDTTSVRAVHSFPEIEDCFFPKFNGVGTGIYYRPKLHKHVHDLSQSDIQDFILKKVRKLEIRNDTIQSGFKDRLNKVIYEIDDHVLQSGDSLNLFYLYERMSIWGSMVQKSNWNLREFSPFASSEVIMKTFQLPLLFNLTYPLHKEIIKRYIPETYWMKINNNPFIRFPFFSLPDKVYNRLIIFQKRYYSAYNRLTKLRNSHSSIAQIRSDYFSNNLEFYLNKLLLEDHSLSIQIFGKEYIKNLITEHINKTKNYIRLLGKLVSIEEFRKMVEKLNEKN